MKNRIGGGVGSGAGPQVSCSEVKGSFSDKGEGYWLPPTLRNMGCMSEGSTGGLFHSLPMLCFFGD